MSTSASVVVALVLLAFVTSGAGAVAQTAGKPVDAKKIVAKG